MVTKACVLRSGGDFRPEHVQWLARQVPGLVCLSDVDVPGVETIRLQTDWPGWWAKLEMFGPLLRGDVLMLDLDTVVREMPLMPTRTTVLRDFTQPDVIGSGFMFVTATDRARCWEAFKRDPVGIMASCTKWPRWGDQGFLMDHLAAAQRWQDVAKVYSYKVHCRSGVPSDAQVVCFHGKPRPWDVRDAWVPPCNATPARRDFRELILAHQGARICVMGGAPSLAEQLEHVEADVFISTNAHGAQLVDPDYLLAMDEWHSKFDSAEMGAWLRARCSAPIISPHAYADLRLGSWPQNPRFVLSGLVAAWAAFAMGARVVILAGCDGYGGDPGYVNEARKIARDIYCPVRVAGGGPLTQVWPAFDPKEKFVAQKPHSAIDGLRGVDGMVRVKAIKPCTVGRADLKKGDELTAPRHEVARLLKHRMVEEVGAVEEQQSGGDDLESKTAAELKELATAKGLTFKGNVSKKDLIEMLSVPAA